MTIKMFLFGIACAFSALIVSHLTPSDFYRPSPFSELRKAGVTLIEFEERDRMIQIHSTAGMVIIYWDYTVEVDGEITLRAREAEELK